MQRREGGKQDHLSTRARKEWKGGLGTLTIWGFRYIFFFSARMGVRGKNECIERTNNRMVENRAVREFQKERGREQILSVG